ncbi:MAG: ABC transporter permease [archaeon]|nr:ABC transporter permease [archaeon]
MNVDLSDDIRQAVVICRNEMRKFVHGKKFLIFSIIMLAILGIETIVPYALGDGYDNVDQITAALLGTLATIITLAGVLFTSTSIVSEFQDRTALILLTKPVRKWVIYLGKMFASLIIVIGFTAFYYVFIAVFTLVMEGGFNVDLGKSLIVSVFCIFAITGLCMFVSSIAKNGGTAIIISLLLQLFALSLVSSLLHQFAHIDTWWCMTDAMNSIVYCMDLSGFTLPGSTTPVFTMEPVEDTVRNVVVLFVWGVVTSVAGCYLFKRRDM